MDHTTLMCNPSFSGTNNNNNSSSSTSLAEIWPFSLGVGGGGGESSGNGIFGNSKKKHFLEHNLSGFGNQSNGFAEESTVTTDQSGRRNKRRDLGLNNKPTTTSDDDGGGDELTKEMKDKRLKSLGSGDDNGNVKSEMEASSGEGNKPAERSKTKHEPPKQEFIHVRARRGQATDSHSLAERARREKISERMRILQDLVPGCNKVIGKALVLDEIINYIQSLQRQVEFLSMKLEAVNSGPSPHAEGFPLKDFGAQHAYETTGVLFGSQATREYNQGGSTSEWLHMQVGGGGGYERTA
ncbi:hypothetical protein MKW94_029141 [Papaver nudicaule]|uniref:BHLH domain-containing protein n=1 Tax=Papaver nudicaule TaxID=74823 RepID=A0AA41RXW0_PAPNU|nr:hypothetical protein [Papaver nudicaule]